MTSCRPHYLPRVFSSVFFVAIYIPPQSEAGTKIELNELYSAISKQENAHPELALLLAGDFNAGKLKSVWTNFKCATRGKITLDHLYSTHRDAYKALPHPPFGKSDHNSILLIPAYKQRLKQEAPVNRSIKKWSDEAHAKLQDCFASTDWNMLQDSSNGIEGYTTSFTVFINKCVDDTVPKVTIHTYPIQKLWLTGNIRTERLCDLLSTFSLLNLFSLSKTNVLNSYWLKTFQLFIFY